MQNPRCIEDSDGKLETKGFDQSSMKQEYFIQNKTEHSVQSEKLQEDKVKENVLFNYVHFEKRNSGKMRNKVKQE